MPIPDRRPGQGANFQPREPAVTTQELGVMVNGSLNTLIEAIKTGNSDKLTSFLQFSSRFHRYSRRNQQLIYSQAPFAQKVASYAKWKEEGFQVKKLEEGERGIRILVPIPPAGFRRGERAKQLADGDGKPSEQYKQTEIGFITSRFKVGSVFDVSHLTPESQERIPSLFTKIDGDHQQSYDRVVTAIRANGIRFEESLNTHGAKGYSAMGLIVVRPDQPVGNRALVALHEYGHELAHREWERRNLPSQVKEAHAEAVSFIVGQYLGIENSYSADYLKDWNVTPELLRGQLDVVTSVASQIIQKIEAVSLGNQQGFDTGETEIN